MVVQIMLSTVLVAAALPIANPAPSTPPNGPLKVIVNIRSTPRCSEIVTHANTAIMAAINDDGLITRTITQLRFSNYDDTNSIHRRDALDALGDLAKQITQQSRSADDEVKQLRAIAAKTTDPQEQKSIKNFADELGGALWRQQKLARDLNGFLAGIDFQDMASFDESQKDVNLATAGVPDPFNRQPREAGNRTVWPHPEPLGHDPAAPSASQQAKAIADDFQSRLPSITNDENDAATDVPGALTGC